MIESIFSGMARAVIHNSDYPSAEAVKSQIRRVTIVACGTSFYAGMVAKYWFEQFARVPVDLDVASEFRYRAPVEAIDRYFAQRNLHFQQHPQRAGKRFWGKDLVRPTFSDSNNCKDPRWR